MPSVSESQRKFFGADLGRKRKGQKTTTGLSESQLEDYARSNKKTRSTKRAAGRKHKRKSGRK